MSPLVLPGSQKLRIRPKIQEAPDGTQDTS